MDKTDFKIVNDNGTVSIVRTQASNVKKSNQPEQRIKVMCFDSAQIDRIFRIQEKTDGPVSRINYFKQ